MEPDEVTDITDIAITPQDDASQSAASQYWAPHDGAPAIRADADSIAALESELGAIETELHTLDHDSH